MEQFDYDAIIVGSGFGGSVAALRLSEKGYRVAVLEAGRRFDAATLPRSSWDVRRFLWAPLLGCLGIQRVHFLRDVVVLAGAGVGGGSLNYANTLYEPLPAFYDDPQWAGIADWRSELAPYYEQAKRMLGVVDNPLLTPADEAMRQVACEMGAGETFRLAPVGVFFGPDGGQPGKSYADPYFGGAGRARQACRHCGECMTGCRHGSKNTLLTNYLHLAERAGAVVVPLTTVRSLEPKPGGGWLVGTDRTTMFGTGHLAHWGRRTMSAGQVVLAAGAFGTQKLLQTMVLEGKLPELSPRLGELTRTNSESLLGATVARGRPHPDFSRGVAITSSFYPEPGTHAEPVRYGHGSNMMGLFGTMLVKGRRDGGASDGDASKGSTSDAGASDAGASDAGASDGGATDGGADRRPGWARWLATAARDPRAMLASFDLRAWSERTVIALVMQSHDNSLTVSAKRGFLGPRLTSRQGHGQPSPTWLPIGHDLARRLAKQTGGRPAANWGEIFGMPLTAHFLGGCAIGASPDQGVVDPWHRVYSYPGLHVVDGSAIPANPGANPALTITALAERAFSYWPNSGGPDPRPPLGATFVAPRVPVVAAESPVVPAGAQGELRFRRTASE